MSIKILPSAIWMDQTLIIHSLPLLESPVTLKLWSENDMRLRSFWRGLELLSGWNHNKLLLITIKNMRLSAPENTERLAKDWHRRASPLYVCQRHLDKVGHTACENGHEFYAEVAQYIGNRISSDNKPILWPIVDRVKIFLEHLITQGDDEFDYLETSTPMP